MMLTLILPSQYPLKMILLMMIWMWKLVMMRKKSNTIKFPRNRVANFRPAIIGQRGFAVAQLPILITEKMQPHMFINRRQLGQGLVDPLNAMKHFIGIN